MEQKANINNLASICLWINSFHLIEDQNMQLLPQDLPWWIGAIPPQLPTELCGWQLQYESTVETQKRLKQQFPHVINWIKLSHHLNSKPQWESMYTTFCRNERGGEEASYRKMWWIVIELVMHACTSDWQQELYCKVMAFVAGNRDVCMGQTKKMFVYLERS